MVALLGTCRLDLRDAHLDGEVSKMTATVFLGGVTIVIPPGVEVRPSGLSLLGGASWAAGLGSQRRVRGVDAALDFPDWPDTGLRPAQCSPSNRPAGRAPAWWRAS